jgi:hypothetical protein
VSQHYEQLKDIAQRTLRAEHETAGFGAAALAPTSLVTETVIRLMDQRDLPANDSHLRGLASVFMTRVIADRRRNRLAAKRDVRHKPKKKHKQWRVDKPTPRDVAHPLNACISTPMKVCVVPLQWYTRILPCANHTTKIDCTCRTRTRHLR